MHGLFLTEGKKAVSELLQSDFEIERIIAKDEDSNIPNIEVMDKADLASISSFKSPSDVIAIARIKLALGQPKVMGPIFLLDSIRDPGNVGTIIRTVRWFGASDLIVSSDCADVYNPKTIQASMGAVFHLRIHTTDLSESIETLKSSGYRIFGTEMNGTPLNETELPADSAIIIGNEGQGINQSILDLCDEQIAIEGGNINGVESLNAAMSVGIIAHHLYLGSNGK
ncbi:MAG: TrmH family RNA methyltransferase [Granulosicoccus sp.]|jgi:TrmH family RNA methyltransferase